MARRPFASVSKEACAPTSSLCKLAHLCAIKLLNGQVCGNLLQHHQQPPDEVRGACRKHPPGQRAASGADTASCAVAIDATPGVDNARSPIREAAPAMEDSLNSAQHPSHAQKRVAADRASSCAGPETFQDTDL